MVCPITTDADTYAHEVVAQLNAQGLRARADTRNEKINYKVREHSVAKVPVILAVGMREAEGKTVSMRRLGSKDQTVWACKKPPTLCRWKPRRPIYAARNCVETRASTAGRVETAPAGEGDCSLLSTRAQN